MAKNYLSNKEIQILTGALEPETEGATGPTGSLYTNTTDGTVWAQIVGGDVTGWKELGATGDNIYNSDGTIAVDRIVSTGANTIKFDGSLILDEKPSIYIDANQHDIIFEKYLEGVIQRRGTLYGGGIIQDQIWTLPNVSGIIPVGPAWDLNIAGPDPSDDGNAIAWNDTLQKYELTDVSDTTGATNGLNLDGSNISLGGLLGEKTEIGQYSPGGTISDLTLTLKDLNFQYSAGIATIGAANVDILRTDKYYAGGKISVNSSVIRIGGNENITKDGGAAVYYCAGATLTGYETHTSLDDTSAITVLNGQAMVLNAYKPEVNFVSDIDIYPEAVGIASTGILIPESGSSIGEAEAISSINLSYGNTFYMRNWQLRQTGSFGSSAFKVKDEIYIGQYSNSSGGSHIGRLHYATMKTDLAQDYTGSQVEFFMDPSNTIGGNFYAHKININAGNFPTVTGTKYGISIDDSDLLNQFYGGIEYGTFSKIYSDDDEDLNLYGKSSVFFRDGGGGTSAYTRITTNEIACVTTDYTNQINENTWQIQDLNTSFEQTLNFAGTGSEPLTANRDYEFPDESGVLALRGLYTQTLVGMTTAATGSVGASFIHGITDTIVGYTIICEAVDGKLITPNETAIANSNYSAWVTSTTINYSGDFTANSNVASSPLKFLITHTI